MSRHQLRKPKRHCARRGFSLLEIIVAIAIVAMISSGIAIAVAKQDKNAKIKMTTVNAGAIRMGIKTWWIDHDTGSCPDVKALVLAGAIERGKTIEKDAWGQAWKIQCEDSDAVVSSKGPDGAPSTEDDILVPSS